MTLDEAIKHCEEVADTCEDEASKYDMTDIYESQVACKEGECANEHRQLAKWLKDYKRLLQQEKEKEWPQDGDCYFYLDSIGGLYATRYTSDDFIDGKRIEIGNCFKTKEEAEFELERLKVLAEMKKFAEPKDREWDGKNVHWLISVDMTSKDINYDLCSTAWKYDSIYFESEEKARECVASVGEGRIKKYYLRIG